MGSETIDISHLHLSVHPEQAAGHGNMLHTDEAIDGVRKIFKPIEPMSREVEFYKSFSQETDELLVALRTEFTPVYYGEVIIGDVNHIVLEDLCSHFVRPCVLDLKIGTRQYTTGMSAKKQQDAIAKATRSTSGKYGLRICGAKSWQATTNSFIIVDKKQGMQLTRERLVDAFATFLGENEPGAMRHHVLSYYTAKVQRLLQLMREQTEYRFYSASLLFVYDAAPGAPDVDLRIIDFAHSFKLDEAGQKLVHTGNLDEFIDGGAARAVDVGFVLGLETLLEVLNEVAARAANAT